MLSAKNKPWPCDQFESLDPFVLADQVQKRFRVRRWDHARQRGWHLSTRSVLFFASDATYAPIAVGDLNGDGKPDFALASLANNVAVALNACAAAAPPAPQLSISHGLPNGVLSWPASVAGFSLEFTTNLASPNWQRPSGSFVTNNNTIQYSIPLNQQQQFFRLHL